MSRRHLTSWRVPAPIVWLARAAVGGVFAYAAVPKLVDPVSFATTIANYQAFPYWSWNALAAVVPTMELVGALSVLTGWKRQAGAVLLGALTCGFLALIASVIIRGIDVSCGCFGSEASVSSGVGWELFFRDVGLLVGVWLAGRETARS